MKSPLEDNPKVLEKIGKFIVLFNLIDSGLSIEFIYIISQIDPKVRPILDFLCSQQISIKLQILKNFTGDDICSEIDNINEFRNHISHGTYGKNSLSGSLSNTKRNRKGKYTNIPLDEKILDKYIEREREVLNKFHQLRLKRMKK